MDGLWMVKILILILWTWFGSGSAQKCEQHTIASGRTCVMSSKLFYCVVGTSQQLSLIDIGRNGVITFTQGVWGYVSTPFPLSYALVSPFWTDINLYVSGQAYHREMATRDASTEAEFAAVDDVLNTCGRVMCMFETQWMYVVTWVNVGYYGSSAGGSIVNSFQAILATDGTRSAGIFFFEDINWSGGITNGAMSSNGLGGTGAQVGFNQGDGVRYFYLPGSRVSNEVINLDTISNIGLNKVFAYRVDQNQIVALEVQQLEDTYGNPIADGHLCFDDTANAQVICEATGCLATGLDITWQLNGVPAPGTNTVVPPAGFTRTATLEFPFMSAAYDGQTLTCYAEEGELCEETTSVTVHDSSTEFVMMDMAGIPITNSRGFVPPIGPLVAGDIVQFICAYDPAQCGPYQSVDWDVGGTALTDTESAGSVGLISGQVSVVQTIEITPTMSGQLITCQFPDGSVKRAVEIMLLVPVDIVPVGDAVGIGAPDGPDFACFGDGAPVQFDCYLAGCTPDMADFTWTINGYYYGGTNTDDGGVVVNTVNSFPFDGANHNGEELWCQMDDMCTGLMHNTSMILHLASLTLTDTSDVIRTGVYNTYAGDSIRFRCYFDSTNCFSSETVDWTFDDAGVSDTDEAAVLGVADMRSVHEAILIASGDNDKNLTCEMAESGASRTLTIIVNVPPLIENMNLMIDGVPYEDGDQAVLVQGLHDFQCSSAHARPAPDITWDFDATVVAEDDGLPVEQPDTLFNYTSYIYDRQIDYNDDCSATVTCTAMNLANTLMGTTPPSISVELLVISPPEQYSPWVRLNSGLGLMPGNFEATLVHGSSVTFDCWVHKADPDVSIDWSLEQINNGLLVDSSVDGVETDPDCSDDSQLSQLTFVPNVDEHHEQSMTCNAFNEYYNISRVVDLQVQIPLYTFSRCVYALSEPSLLVFRVERTPNIGDEIIEQTTGRVTVDTSALSASATFDFEDIVVELEFPPGVTYRDHYIHLAENRIPEDSEEFSIALVDPEHGRLGDCSETRIIVSDDDVLYSFLFPSVVVLESDRILNVTIERQGKLDMQVTVGVDLLASPTSDYASTKRTTLVFPVGVSHAYYLLPLVDDNIIEEDEEIQLYLSNPSIGYTAGIQEVDGTIVDDDAIITIEAVPTTVTEDDGTVSVIVTRTGYLQIAQSIYVRTGYLGDSAKANEDYIPEDVKLDFGPGQSVNYDLDVSIRDDNIPEERETFLIQIYDIDGPLESLGEPKEVEITIIDDDSGPTDTSLFSLGQDSYTVVESDGSLEVRIYRNGPTSQEGSVVFFTGYHSDGNARAPNDYYDMSKRVRFQVGDNVVTEHVTIVDDDIREITETFWVGLRVPLGGKLGDIDSAVVTLVDDQMSFVSDFSTPNRLSVNEAFPSLPITLKREGYMGRAAVDVEVLPNNQAVPDDDFELPSNIKFPEGEEEITISLGIVNNEIQESREVVDFRFFGDEFDNDVTIRVEISDDDLDEPQETDNEGLGTLAYVLIGSGVGLVFILSVTAIITGILCWRSALFKSLQVQHRPRAGPVMRPSRPIQQPRSPWSMQQPRSYPGSHPYYSTHIRR